MIEEQTQNEDDEEQYDPNMLVQQENEEDEDEDEDDDDEDEEDYLQKNDEVAAQSEVQVIEAKMKVKHEEYKKEDAVLQ